MSISGCPTDYSLMGVVQEVNGTAQLLQADFDAFKFPTSNVVQFRALVWDRTTVLYDVTVLYYVARKCAFGIIFWGKSTLNLSKVAKPYIYDWIICK